MSDLASGKHDGSDLPGRPIQPGQVLNPKGANQYTYKRDFELTIDALLKGELSPEEVESAPEWVRAAAHAPRFLRLTAVFVLGLDTFPFKLEHIETVVRMLSQDCWMTGPRILRLIWELILWL